MPDNRAISFSIIGSFRAFARDSFSFLVNKSIEQKIKVLNNKQKYGTINKITEQKNKVFISLFLDTSFRMPHILSSVVYSND